MGEIKETIMGTGPSALECPAAIEGLINENLPRYRCASEYRKSCAAGWADFDITFHSVVEWRAFIFLPRPFHLKL